MIEIGSSNFRPQSMREMNEMAPWRRVLEGKDGDERRARFSHGPRWLAHRGRVDERRNVPDAESLWPWLKRVAAERTFGELFDRGGDGPVNVLTALNVLADHLNGIPEGRPVDVVLMSSMLNRTPVTRLDDARQRERNPYDLFEDVNDRGVVPDCRDLNVSVNVLFHTAEAVIRSDADAAMNELLVFARRHDRGPITVAGHTDSVGTPGHNQELSKRRAAAVAQWLVIHQMPRERITVMGFGAQWPVASNDDANGRQQNRRVEVSFAGGER